MLDAGFKTMQTKLTEIHMEGCEDGPGGVIPESRPALEMLFLTFSHFRFPWSLRKFGQVGGCVS